MMQSSLAPQLGELEVDLPPIFGDSAAIFRFFGPCITGPSQEIAAISGVAGRQTRFSLPPDLSAQPDLAWADRAEFRVGLPGSGETVLVAAFFKSEGTWRRDPDVHTHPRRMVGFSLTNQCNLTCSMCFQGNREERVFLDPARIGAVLDAISPFGKPPVYLWGGEPFLHPAFMDIVRLIKAKGFFCIVNTNGALLRQKAQEIVDSGLDMLIVSIDGVAAVHDSVRQRPGLFARIEEGLEEINRLKRRKPLLAINSVITPQNYRDLSAMVELKRRLQVDYLEFQHLIFYDDRESDAYIGVLREGFGCDGASIEGYRGEAPQFDLDAASVAFFPAIDGMTERNSGPPSEVK